MKKIQRLPTYAEILNHAADHCLWDGREGRGDVIIFSCCSVWDAVRKLYNLHHANDTLGSRVTNWWSWQRRGNGVGNWLKTLGVNPQSTSEYEAFTNPIDRQGARYMWLKFAAQVAEDEGR